MTNKDNSAWLDSERKKAEETIRSGDLASAEKHILNVMESGPPFPYGYVELARMFLTREDIGKAEEYLNKALDESPDMVSARFLLGEIYLTQDNAKKALGQFRKITRLDPKDHEAWFNLANACITLGMMDEARLFVYEAHTLRPDNVEYSEALAALYYAKKEFAEAFRLLSGLNEHDSDRIETWNLFADCAEKIGNTAAAKKALKRSLELDSDQKSIIKKLNSLETDTGNVLKSGDITKKIALFSSIDSFLGDITSRLRQTYDVRMVRPENMDDISRNLDWCDLAWFEWCDPVLVNASKLKKRVPVVCRLHRYEAFTPYPEEVDWSFVDHLVCVLEPIADIVKNRVNSLPETSVIHNGVDFSLYSVPENKKYGKKVAYSGYMKKQKSPEILLQCFAAIRDHDPEYTFHIAGTFPDLEAELYLKHMLKKLDLNVELYGWVDPIAPWLSDKDYIISSSLSESFQYSVVEGIGRGLLPLVHTWPGSELVYPEECLYRTPAECVEILKFYEEGDKPELVNKYRDMLRSKFDLELQLEKIESLIKRYI